MSKRNNYKNEIAVVLSSTPTVVFQANNNRNALLLVNAGENDAAFGFGTEGLIPLPAGEGVLFTGDGVPINQIVANSDSGTTLIASEA